MKKQISFYKKKPFYIVLIVIFSVLLVLDVAIGLFAPSMNMGFGGNGDFSQMPSGGSFPGGMDFGDMEMPDGMDFGDMEMPDGMEFDEENMPFGQGDMPFGDGEMPSFEDMPSRGEDSSSGEGRPSFDNMPSMGGGSFPGGSSQNANAIPAPMGFLQTIKNNWVWIAVVLVVLDGASIYMLLRIKKNEKKNGTKNGSGNQGEVLAIEESPREYPEWVKKIVAKRDALVNKFPLFKYIGKVIVAILLIFVIVVCSVGSAGEADSQVKISVNSGIVEKGEITKVVSGTGTLTDETAESVELPDDIEITKWYVSNGDVVVEGQKLAQIDKVSVMSAIAEIQEKLTELDEELEDKEEETISENIEATTDGKVKVIYAESGESVVDTMYEHGALMLLSLDGMMAVRFETAEELYAGDAVSVATEDGTTLSGKVESVTNGNVVITISNDSAEYAESVTVSTEEGVVLGTGELYIHSELKVTGYAGSVSSVDVSVNEEVDKEDSLLTLSDTEYKAEYETLLLERRELEIMMQELVEIYQEGYIYADIDGVIKGIDESLASVEETSESSGTSVATSGFMGGDMSGQQGGQNQQNDMSQQGSEMQQGTTGSTGMDFGDYAVSTTTLVSIVPQNKLTISVTVDEMDILSVVVGQETNITLDAFPGQSFTGSVSAVDYNGTNSGGSTKYTVDVTMDHGENMLDGMNAAVSIIVDKTEGILLVPVESLVEDESGVYVYTQYNEKKESFENPVAVTTGVSDGTYVEVLSGLEEGSEYWYSSLDTIMDAR